MHEAINILLTEDVPVDAELELRELRRAGLRVTACVVDTEPAFLEALQSFKPDVILSDFAMPDFDGMAALALARERCPEVPFIFVSGTLGEEYAIRALKSGAVDYVLKGNLLRLPSSVERAVAEARGRAGRMRAETELTAAREQLSSIFTTLRDVLWSRDAATGRSLYVSPAIESVYGRPAQAFLDDKDLWLRVVHPEDLPRVEADWQRLPEGREFDCEYRIVRPDGGARWIHDRGRRVEAGGAARIDGVARDVTEQAEQRLRIARLSKIRDVLSAVNNAIVRIRDRSELLSEACRIAVELGGLKLARIEIADPLTGAVGIAAVCGEGSELYLSPEQMAQHGIEPAGGLAGACIAARDVVVYNNLEQDTGVPDCSPLAALMRERGVWSCAGFPLLIDGVAAGAFVLHASDRAYFDHEEVRLLKEVTGNIAFALSLLDKQEKLNYLAYYDPLTGLSNRAFFRSGLAEAVDNATRHGHMAAVLAFDIARFKSVNDALGQQAGDRLLQQVADRLKRAAGEDGRVSRLSGDQFCMLVPVLKSLPFVPRVLLERVTALLDQPFAIEGRELHISTRAGIAVFPNDGADADTVYRNAEAAHARARASGERFTFYAPEMNARFAERLEMENRLRRALDRGELALYYQPKVETVSRGIVGLEALMRWNDPAGGVVPPGKFIPILEDTGLIVEAGRWAMRRALEDQRAWRSRGRRVPRVAVNVSTLQLRNAGFVEDLSALLGGVPPEERMLDIEITESVLMENMADAVQQLKAVRELGVEIAIDDFGTGYSSLAYINRLPIQLLKIDRSFVSGADDAQAGEGAQESAGIVSTIIALARGLRLGVIAEGVETEAQAELLRELHCDLMQGFLVGRPVPADEVERLLQRA
jgi:diguanylate cyclase (GGDEF)-like protein/PAS domain S-box-containing protein